MRDAHAKFPQGLLRRKVVVEARNLLAFFQFVPMPYGPIWLTKL
jgi:hypothetical protein